MNPFPKNVFTCEAADLVDLVGASKKGAFGEPRHPADPMLSLVMATVHERLSGNKVDGFSVRHISGADEMTHSFAVPEPGRIMESAQKEGETHPCFQRLWRLENDGKLVATGSNSGDNGGPYAVSTRSLAFDKEGGLARVDTSLTDRGRSVFRGTMSGDPKQQTRIVTGALGIRQVQVEKASPETLTLSLRVKMENGNPDVILALTFDGDEHITQITPTIVDAEEQPKPHFFHWENEAVA